MHKFHDYGVPGFATELPRALQTRMQTAASLVHYDDGQDVHQRGDTHSGLALIRTGAVKLSSVGRTGRKLVTALLGPGHVFGEFTVFADLPRTHTATAFGQTSIDHITKTKVESLLDTEPTLNHFFLSSLTRRLHATLEFAEDLRRLPPYVHAVKRLAEMARWPTGSARIAITQSALAQTLGISRMAMSTALKALECQNLLQTGYGYIDILDGTSLRRWLISKGALSEFS
jgi:CRP-like cAMP-binding protein